MENPEKSDQSSDLDIEERIILNHILQKQPIVWGCRPA